MAKNNGTHYGAGCLIPVIIFIGLILLLSCSKKYDESMTIWSENKLSEPLASCYNADSYPNDSLRILITDSASNIGIGSRLNEFEIGEKVNKINTPHWGIVQAIHYRESKAQYYIKFKNGDEYWVTEDLLAGEKSKYVFHIGIKLSDIKEIK